MVAVTDPDGTTTYRAPLARHHRIDHDHHVLWIRPIVGDSIPGSGGTLRFGLNACRRRSLPSDRAAADVDQIRFELATDQTAHIRVAGDDLHAQLERWDAFVLTVLPADIELTLEDLTDDSWHGPWA